MKNDLRLQPRQPIQNRPMAVRKTDAPPKKKSGCSGFGAAMFLFVILGIVLLMLTGVLPSPFDPQVTPPPQVNNPTAPVYFITPQTEATAQPSPTNTAAVQPTSTATPVIVEEPSPTPTNRPMPFVLRGQPEGYPNAMLHPQYECSEYLFIGGEVWDLREAPVLGLSVRLSGTYGGHLVDFTSLSGDVALYGKSGFEFVMENRQIAEDDLWIQLFDQNDQPLSAPVNLIISGECDANLLIVNYKQVQEIPEN